MSPVAATEFSRIAILSSLPGARLADLASRMRREDIAPFFGPLSAAEVRYLMQHEWAQQPDDVLWRRTKLGLKVGKAEKDALAQFMADVLADKPV